MKKFYTVVLLIFLCSSCQLEKSSINQINDSDNLNSIKGEENLKEAAGSKKEALCSEKDKCREEIIKLRSEYKELACAEIASENNDDSRCVDIKKKLGLFTDEYNKLQQQEKDKLLEKQKEDQDKKEISENKDASLEDENLSKEKSFEERFFSDKNNLHQEINDIRDDYEKMNCVGIGIVFTSEPNDKQAKCMKNYEKLSSLMYDYKKLQLQEKNKLIIEIAEIKAAHEKLGCKGDLSEDQYAECVRVFDNLMASIDRYYKLLSEDLDMEVSIEDEEFERLNKEIAEEKAENDQEDVSSTYSKEFIFEHKNKNHTFTMEFSRNKYLNYQSYSKSYEYYYKLPAKWQLAYFEMFVFDGDDDALITQVIDEIKKIDSNMTDEELLKAVISFVQYIPYDWEDYYTFMSTGYGFMKYPYETLAGNTGICGDKSILLAKLLAKLDYKVSILLFPKANHAAVGIGCKKGFDNFQSGYCFVESTAPAPVGFVFDKYGEGVVLDKKPIVLDMNKGNNFPNIESYAKERDELIAKYGKDYAGLTLEEQKVYIEMYTIGVKVDELDAEIKELEKELNKSGCKKSKISDDKILQCNKIVSKLNNLGDEYNREYDKFNKKLEELQKKLEESYPDLDELFAS